MSRPMNAASGAATSPIARSLSLDRAMSASISSTGLISWTSFSFGSSSGRTMEYLTRSQNVILGALSPAESPAPGVEGIGEGYNSPGDAHFALSSLAGATEGHGGAVAGRQK